MNSNNFWMRFTVDGKSYCESAGTEDEKTAKEIWKRLEAKIALGQWHPELLEKRKHTFDEMMDNYLNGYSMINKKPKTVKNDRCYIKHLAETFSGITLDKITPDLISGYKARRISDGAMPQTVKHEMNCLSQAFKIAIDELSWIKDNPCVKVKKPRVKKSKIRWLTTEEEIALLNSAQGYLHGQLPDIITTALHTGFRKDGILELKWKDIDLFRKAITIMQDKTNEQVTIPMSDTLFQLLTARSKVVNMSGYVFATSKGTRILPGNLDREFWKALKIGGIEKFRFHDLRHTFATRLIQAGVDIYTVSKLLGHKDIETTTRYTHLLTANLKSAVRVLDNFSAGKEPEKQVENG